MNYVLLEVLRNLKRDPTYVIQVYGELYKSKFLAIVQPGSEKDLQTTEFLTYPTIDKISELPIFTSDEFIIEFQSIPTFVMELPGDKLWPRLLDIVKTRRLEVAVDPGQTHGIRLNREMILGMISAYATG